MAIGSTPCTGSAGRREAAFEMLRGFNVVESDVKTDDDGSGDPMFCVPAFNACDAFASPACIDELTEGDGSPPVVANGICFAVGPGSASPSWESLPIIRAKSATASSGSCTGTVESAGCKDAGDGDICLTPSGMVTSETGFVSRAADCVGVPAPGTDIRPLACGRASCALMVRFDSNESSAFRAALLDSNCPSLAALGIVAVC